MLLDSDAETRVSPWRDRLIQQLRDRPEGFTDGTRLIPGQPHEYLVPGRNIAKEASTRTASR